jgi:hypothetical protein
VVLRPDEEQEEDEDEEGEGSAEDKKLEVSLRMNIYSITWPRVPHNLVNVESANRKHVQIEISMAPSIGFMED